VELRLLRELASVGFLTDQIVADEIAERRRVISTMVGWLYPSILLDEIAEIIELVTGAPVTS